MNECELRFALGPLYGFVQILIKESGKVASMLVKQSLQLAFQTAVLVLVFASAARAGDETAPFSPQELQAKIEYCQRCHQRSGQGIHAATPIPRLAGQQVEYLENQLQAFIDHRRIHSVMENVAHNLSPALRKAIAEHFSNLNPKPIGGAPKELVAGGKQIYEEGVPDANIPPCASCHGPEARGNGAFPRLAGQLDEYIQAKLLNWSNERGQDPDKPDTSAIMQPIAHTLTKAQIAAVAAYLNYLE